MSARKTYPVEALVDLVNGICKNSAPDAKELRFQNTDCTRVQY